MQNKNIFRSVLLRLTLVFTVFWAAFLVTSVKVSAQLGISSRPAGGIPYLGRKANDTAAGVCAPSRTGWVYYNTTTDLYRFCDGSSWGNMGSAGGTGLTELNSLTADPQSFATGTSGSDFNINSASSTHTFNIPSASSSNRGLLTSSDWTAFNAKPTISSGSGAPSSTPAKVGDIYIDTTGDDFYFAVGTSSSADWEQAGSGGGGGSPGGSTGQVQYNSSGSFAGSSHLTFSETSTTGFRVGNSTESNAFARLAFANSGASPELTLQGSSGGSYPALHINPNNGTSNGGFIIANGTASGLQINGRHSSNAVEIRGNNRAIAQFRDNTSAVNYFQLANAAATNSPVISVDGSDTNINLTLTPKGTGKVIASSDVEVPDEAYDATDWNGSLEVPTKNAVRDALESISSGGVSDGDKGDITVASSGTSWTIDDGVITDGKFHSSSKALAITGAWKSADGTGPTTLAFAEDTDNGSNTASIAAPASLASDVTITLPSSTGTLALTSGNVATATALASNPTDCSANTFATTIAANGNLTCSAVGTNAISNNAVTYAKFQQAAANSVIANNTGSTANVAEVALSASNLLGRGSTGNVAPITVSGGLSFSGTVLSSSQTALGVEQAASLPGTIAQGQVRQLTSGGRFFIATAADTWGEIPTAPESGSSGGQFIRRNSGNTAFENYTMEFQGGITIPSPTGSENATITFLNQASTITKIVFIAQGTTPSVTWTLCHNTDRSDTCNTIESGTGNSTTTGNVITSSFDDATIPANSFIWLELSSPSGTINEVSLHFFYTKD